MSNSVFMTQKNFLISRLREQQVELHNYVTIDHMSAEYEKVVEELRLARLALVMTDQVAEEREAKISALEDKFTDYKLTGQAYINRMNNRLLAAEKKLAITTNRLDEIKRGKGWAAFELNDHAEKALKEIEDDL